MIVAAVVTSCSRCSAARWWLRADAAAAEAARSGLGGDRGLPEQHGRSGVRSHARADAEARAGRRRVHQRLRSQQHPPTLGVRPPEKLDEEAAREIAVKQGLESFSRVRSIAEAAATRFRSRRLQAVTGEVDRQVRSRASSKEQVLGGGDQLVTTVRKALGDETSDSAQLFAMRSCRRLRWRWSSHYAAAIEAQSEGKYEEARQSYLKTVELDPELRPRLPGAGGHVAEPRQASRMPRSTSRKRLRHLDGMTERERFSTRALTT